MIARVADVVVKAGLEPRILVVNPLFGPDVRAALEESGCTNLTCVVQPQRRGAANAVMQAIPALVEKNVEHFLVIYADMPLWTVDTIRRLIDLHSEASPVVSMATVPLRGNYPSELKRYGRIIRDSEGAILRVVEPVDATPAELINSDSVNPSLWIWERTWFAAHAPAVPFAHKGDGFDPEQYLPSLVGMARSQGKPVHEMSLADPWEALGVNNPDELTHVREVFAKRISRTSEPVQLYD